MCDICKKSKEIEHAYLALNIVKKRLNIRYSAYSCDSDFNTDIKIEYCPFCGEWLPNVTDKN